MSGDPSESPGPPSDPGPPTTEELHPSSFLGPGGGRLLSRSALRRLRLDHADAAVVEMAVYTEDDQSLPPPLVRKRKREEEEDVLFAYAKRKSLHFHRKLIRRRSLNDGNPDPVVGRCAHGCCCAGVQGVKPQGGGNGERERRRDLV